MAKPYLLDIKVISLNFIFKNLTKALTCMFCNVLVSHYSITFLPLFVANLFEFCKFAALL